jgi:hypothetical protein
METQLVNLGRGTAQKLSCGVDPNQFVVRPLHAVSPVVGAHLRLECYPVLRWATIRNGVPGIPPSSAQPHARPRDRESSAHSEKNLRSGSPALQSVITEGRARFRIDTQWFSRSGCWNRHAGSPPARSLEPRRSAVLISGLATIPFVEGEKDRVRRNIGRDSESRYSNWAAFHFANSFDERYWA